MSRKIIIDTDPGIDDSMAIFYALASPELEVLGLTTVFGNASIDFCTMNALRLLEIAGRPDIPVARGSERPFSRPFKGGADFVHGADGQGNVHLPPPDKTVVAQNACEFMVNKIMEAPQQITIVAIGPLTNVAMALMFEPDLAKNIQEIVIMGGNAFVPGNASPSAEANILNDPEAADIVFGADCPITMCGLDVTEKVFMPPPVLDGIGKISNPRARHLNRILPCYRSFHKSRYGEDGIHVHDSNTITYLLAPNYFKTVRHPIRVDTSPGIGRGKTWPALGRSDTEIAWQGRRQVNICVEVDAESAIALELERLSQP